MTVSNWLGLCWQTLVLAASLAVSASALADTCTSRASGDWNTASTWRCVGTSIYNGVPQNGDSVVIANGFTVTLNANTNSLVSLTVNAGGTLAGDANSRVINLNGNLVNNGSIAVTGGSASRLVVHSASTWSGSGSLSLDYLDVNWQTLTLNSASTMSITLTDADPIRNVTGFNNGASPNRSATVYLGGTTQTIDDYGLQFPNLTLSGGAKSVTASTFAVLGNLTIGSGASLSTDSVSTVTLGGNLTINGSLSSFTGGSTTWTFNGSAAQTISAAASFRNLTLNNSAGLVLGGDLTIGDSSWGTLTLTSGKLSTGAYTVIIPRNCSGSMTTRTAGSWIDGKLQLLFPAYNASCIFDVGDASNYAPIVYTYPWHAAPLGGTVTGSTTGGDHPDSTAGTSGIDAARSVNRYWTLAAGSGATFYTYDATFQYCAASGTADCAVNDVDSGATASNFKVAAKAGSWTRYTPTAPATNQRAVTGLGSLGVYAIGEAGAANRCSQPANTPAGLTLSCQCDTFGRSSLNPSPMFASSNWTVSTADATGIVPYINGSTGFLRLTESTSNNAKAATAPGFFPAAGNYISVEFKHYAYNGDGADGIAVILSDYTVAAVPGAYGGSLGYAQRSGVNGFAGGWIGVGVDEYGNYSNPTEGRVGGRGFVVDGVAVRGSGTGSTGYPYLGGTGASLSPGVDNAGSSLPAYGHFYQIVVDARNSMAGQTSVTVNRDTTGSGSSYSSIVPSFDAFAAATAGGYTQAPVPANWQLSFTGSTGGSRNIHEIGEIRVCAQYYVPPDGGTPGGFSAIDEAYGTAVQNFLSGHIYTKLAGTPFKLKIAALSNSQILTTYAASGTKNVTVKLVDNSDGLCGTDAERTTACATSACNGKSAVTGGSQTVAFTSADQGVRTSADFTLNSAHADLVAVISDGTTTACSVDSFAVRPTRFSSVGSSATNAALTGTPKFKAGTDSVTLTATANAAGYTGTPKIASSGMAATASGWTVGSLSPVLFPNAVSGGSSSTATGSFTYSEVGHFRFLGFDPASDTSSQRGIYDDSWVAVDSAATKNDCIAGSYSNSKDANGKYGCLFGLQDTGASAPNSALFGRFVPAQFAYLGGSVTSYCSASPAFGYMGQAALGIAYRLQAQNGAGAVTTNYSTSLGYPVTTPTLVAEDQTAAHQGCDLASRIGGIAGGQWVAGVFALNDGNADNVPDSASATFSRPASPVVLTTATCSANRANAGGPFRLLDIGVAMNDADAAATLTGKDMDAASAGTCTSCTARKIGATAQYYGRLGLSNAYGSEMLPVAVPALAQFWSSTGWQRQSTDSCTLLTTPTSVNGGLVFHPASVRNALAAGEVVAQLNGSTAASAATVGGDGRLVLRHPASAVQGPGAGNFGFVDVIGSLLTPSSTWLPPSGNARVCFGACGPRSPLIYLREMY